MTEELKISELPPLSPVPSGELPVSQMHGTARVTCKATVQELVQSVAPRAHSHTPADIGLGNVANLAPALMPVSNATATAIAESMNGHLSAADPHGQYTTEAEAAAAAPVQSVAGRTGDVVLTSADVNLALIPNIAPDDWPISDAVQAALDDKLDVGAKIPAADVTGLGAAINAAIATNGVTSVNGQQGDVTITKAGIGLGNVDNTSDASKPVSGPTATAIAGAMQAHVNATNPHEQYATTAQVTQIVTAQTGGLAPVQSVNGMTGSVTITKAGIGLSNVDNTSDANKPVSNAVSAALGSKLDAAALAPALAGKIDSADARFTGIQRQKAQLIAGGTGARVLDPNTAAVMVDSGNSGIGGRTYTIAPITADANDLVWFDYVFAHNSRPFLFSGVKTIATGAIADQTTLPMPPGSDMAVLRFFRQPAGSFNAGNWLVSCIA